MIPPSTGDTTYNFEGINLYRYTTSQFNEEQREYVATFDIINGITTVYDERFDPEEGINVQYTAARGTDSGIPHGYVLEGLTNYTDYYYGVTTYSYINNEFATGSRVVESAPSHLTIRPSRVGATMGGMRTASSLGSAHPTEHIAGDGVGLVAVKIVDPMAIRDATYTVQFYDFQSELGNDLITYDILRNNEEVINGQAVYQEHGLLLGSPNGFNPQIRGDNIVVDGMEFFSVIVNPALNISEFDVDGLPDFSGNDVDYFFSVILDPDGDGVLHTGGGIIQVAGPGSECPDGFDFGCLNYDGTGNKVWHDPNGNRDFYVTAGGSPGTIDRLMRYIEALPPENYEMRFTAEGGYGLYGFGDYTIARVPFELWNIGTTPDDPSDDIRCIPYLNAEEVELSDWEDQFTGVDAWVDSPCPGGCPATDWVYYMMPDRPNGYELFHQAAIGFGGAGATYDIENDGDTQVDPDPFLGDDCPNQGAYTSFCYRNQDFRLNSGPSNFIYPIGRTRIADLSGDGTTPPTGTVIRYLSAHNRAVTPGDEFELHTSSLALVTGDATVLQSAVDDIGIVPNPYLGQSAYETGNFNRVARFTNMPERATIRVYSVAGSLVRTIEKDSPERWIDWDLRNNHDEPIASGIYLIHVEIPNGGERILKFGMVQRRMPIRVE